MNRKQTRFIRRTLYSLKKEFGFSITFHKLTETYDLETGERTPSIEIKKVNKVIVMPDALQRKFEYDLAFIAAAKNFTYGGFYDTSLRRLIIDRQDLGDFELELGMYFIWSEERWEIAKIVEFELQTGFIVFARMVEGATRYQVSEINLESSLIFSQEQEVV